MLDALWLGSRLFLCSQASLPLSQASLCLNEPNWYDDKNIGARLSRSNLHPEWRYYKHRLTLNKKKTKHIQRLCRSKILNFNPGKYCSIGTSGILDLRQATQGHRDGSCVFIFLCSIFRLIDAWFTFWVHLKLRYITADIYIYILMLGFKISKFNCFEMLFIYFFPYKKIFESVAIDLLHLHDIFLLLWQNNVNLTIPPDDERMSSLLFTAHTLTHWLGGRYQLSVFICLLIKQGSHGRVEETVIGRGPPCLPGRRSSEQIPTSDSESKPRRRLLR